MVILQKKNVIMRKQFQITKIKMKSLKGEDIKQKTNLNLFKVKGDQ